MFRRRLFVFALVLCVSAGFSSAFAEQPSQLQVIVAEDKTIEADCKVSLNNGPEQSCAPGSVIWSYETTYAEVKKARIKDYVILTTDAEQNDKLRSQLADKVSKEKRDSSLQESPAINSPCYAQKKLIQGSYWTVGSSSRVSYEMEYSIDAGCFVSNVRDRTKSSGLYDRWYRTCTQGSPSTNPPSGCNEWRIPLNETYTYWKNEYSSLQGAQYRNETYTSSPSSGTSYGYYFFD